jgi:hypothetical protein
MGKQASRVFNMSRTGCVYAAGIIVVISLLWVLPAQAKAARKSTQIQNKSNPSATAPPSSFIRIRKNLGRPASSVSRSQSLSGGDYQFLGNLSGAVKGDPVASARLDRIAADQKKGRPLSKSDSDFLKSTSRKINDDQVTRSLNKIIEKRRAGAN